MRPDRTRAFLAASLAAGLLPLPAEASICEILQFRFMLGADSGAYMNVRSGRDCQVRLTQGKIFKDFEVESVRIVEPPSHGSAKAQGLIGTMYRSNPDYKGKDGYAFAVCGADAKIASCTLVRIKVRVR
jgi:hypothetical protein